jgi:hypothetical protein
MHTVASQPILFLLSMSQVTLFVLDEFFCSGGDSAVFPVICALFDSIAPALAAPPLASADDGDDSAGEPDIMSAVTEYCRTVRADALREALAQPKFKFASLAVHGLRRDARLALAAEWTASDHVLSRLARATSFTKDMLRTLKANFRKVVQDDAGGGGGAGAAPKTAINGMTQDQFVSLMKLSAPQFDSELLSRLFQLYDADGSGFIDFKEVFLPNNWASSKYNFSVEQFY